MKCKVVSLIIRCLRIVSKMFDGYVKELGIPNVSLWRGELGYTIFSYKGMGQSLNYVREFIISDHGLSFKHGKIFMVKKYLLKNYWTYFKTLISVLTILFISLAKALHQWSLASTYHGDYNRHRDFEKQSKAKNLKTFFVFGLYYHVLSYGYYFEYCGFLS